MNLEEIEKLLTELGWKQDEKWPTMWETVCGSMQGSFPTAIELNSETMQLFRYIYAAGNNGVKPGFVRIYDDHTQRNYTDYSEEQIKEMANDPLAKIFQKEFDKQFIKEALKNEK